MAANNTPEQKNQSANRFSKVETAVMGIFILLLLTTLKYAADILVPFTISVMLSLLFAPIVNLLSMLHIQKRIGSAIVIIGMIALIVCAIIFLAGPAEEWLDKSPQLLKKIERKLNKIKKPIQQVKDAAEKVQGLTKMDEEKGLLVVEPATKKLFETVFSSTPEFMGVVLLSIVLLYFLLFKGNLLAKDIIRFIFWLAHQKTPAGIGSFIQHEISKYLITITTINICLGAITVVAFTFIGLPNPILWGTMVAILNFAPYVGAVCSAIIITAVSFVSFPSLVYSLLAPSVFLAITAIEGQIITPQILGNRFSMNPLIIFLFIILWGWLWGYTGVILAFPLLVCLKIICQAVSVLNPLDRFLEGTGKSESDVEI